jgi:hypothetical protein
LLEVGVDSTDSLIATLTVSNPSRKKVTYPIPQIMPLIKSTGYSCIIKIFDESDVEIPLNFGVHMDFFETPTFKLRRNESKSFRFNLSNLYCQISAHGRYRIECTYDCSSNSKWQGKTNYKDVIFFNLDSKITSQQTYDLCREKLIKKHPLFFTKKVRDSLKK